MELRKAIDCSNAHTDNLLLTLMEKQIEDNFRKIFANGGENGQGKVEDKLPGDRR